MLDKAVSVLDALEAGARALGRAGRGHRPAPGHRPPAGRGAGGPRPGRAATATAASPSAPASPASSCRPLARPALERAAGRHRRERPALRPPGRPPAVRGLPGVTPWPAHDRPRGRLAAPRRGLGRQGPPGRRRGDGVGLGRERGGAGAGRGLGQRPGPRSGRRRVAAVSVSGPIERTHPSPGARYAGARGRGPGRSSRRCRPWSAVRRRWPGHARGSSRLGLTARTASGSARPPGSSERHGVARRRLR